jgi:hypothetical protein
MINSIDFHHTMPLKVILCVTINENTRGEKIECIESIRKLEDEICYVFQLEYQARNFHPR